MDYILENYDRNQDGKIELGELSKILNVEDNFLARFQDGDLTKEQFEEVFAHYDKDNKGFIEGAELIGFLRDMRLTQDEESKTTELEKYRDWIMEMSDLNRDGKLQKDELKVLFLG